MSLSTALNTTLSPGSTLYLTEGTYSGNFAFSQNGAPSNPITVCNYTDARAIINGQFAINGSRVRVQGLEVCNNANRDRSAAVGTVGIDCLGDYIEIVNCIIHDHDQGLTTSAVKTGHVYYGNLFYFNGWDSALGHGIYPQNNAGNAKTIKRNFLFDNFGYGIHAWGSAGDVSNFTIDGNTCFENGAPRSALQNNILNGNQSSFTSPIIRNNLTYNIAGQSGGASQVGYGTGNQALDVSVYDNYFVNDGVALAFVDETLTRFDGNTIIGTLTGADIGSNTQILTGYPNSGSYIVLTNNEYDANRAQLTIYNWALANTVDVDVSAIYTNGTILSVHNVQNYFSDIQSLTVTAGTITVNMQAANRTVATPVGWTAPAKTYPQFGAFVLQA